MTHRLWPAPHLWQVGLQPANTRVCWTTVVPVDVDLGGLLAALGELLPEGFAWVPEQGYAHVTLDAAEHRPPPLHVESEARAFNWQATGFAPTPYSLRLALQASRWGAVCAAAGMSERPPYITLGYATSPTDIPAPEFLNEALASLLPEGHGTHVERRRFDSGCAAFSPLREVAIALDRS